MVLAKLEWCIYKIRQCHETDNIYIYFLQFIMKNA
jgi:hypothetical protein